MNYALFAIILLFLGGACYLAGYKKREWVADEEARERRERREKKKPKPDPEKFSQGP